MKQGLFENGNSHRGDTRQILIKITEGIISFYFYDQYLKQQDWIDGEVMRKIIQKEGELSEEEKHINDFYWIDARDWHKSKTENLDSGNNWHKHMERKSWFTNEMETFLDLNTH